MKRMFVTCASALAMMVATAADAQTFNGTIISASGSGEFSGISSFTGSSFRVDIAMDANSDNCLFLHCATVSIGNGNSIRSSLFQNYLDLFDSQMVSAGFNHILTHDHPDLGWSGISQYSDGSRRITYGGFPYLESYYGKGDISFDEYGEPVDGEVSNTYVWSELYISDVESGLLLDPANASFPGIGVTFSTAGTRYGDDPMMQWKFTARNELNGTDIRYSITASITSVTLFEPGQSPDAPWLPATVLPEGGFIFTQPVFPNTPIFFDPPVSVGYDYFVADGSPLITKAMFPSLLGDLDGFDIFALGGGGSALFNNVMGGQWVDFTSIGYLNGISGFSLRDINPALELDPANPLAFVTGLEFATAGTVTLTQTPVTIEWPIPGGGGGGGVDVVPEPASWAMLIAGFGLTGAALRRRRRVVA